jgi:hypothetical protein
MDSGYNLAIARSPWPRGGKKQQLKIFKGAALLWQRLLHLLVGLSRMMKIDQDCEGAEQKWENPL